MFSSGPLFPHPWLAWCRQLAPMFGGCPSKAPKQQVTCWNLTNHCEQCKETLLSLPFNNFPSFQVSNYSLTSLICDKCIYVACGKSKHPKPVLYDAMGRKVRQSNSSWIASKLTIFSERKLLDLWAFWPVSELLYAWRSSQSDWNVAWKFGQYNS